MTVTANKKPVNQSKKAGTNGDKAKGEALALLCSKFSMGIVEEEEKRGNKLRMLVKDLHSLTRDGHKAFREQMQIDLDMINQAQKGAELTSRDTAGYSIGSFRTLCSNWKTISLACELGWSPMLADGSQKGWVHSVNECVALKNAHVSDASTGAQLPTKRKAGRKAGTGKHQIAAAATAKALADAQTTKEYKLPSANSVIGAIKKAAVSLDDKSFTELAAWVDTQLKARNAAAVKAKTEPATV